MSLPSNVLVYLDEDDKNRWLEIYKMNYYYTNNPMNFDLKNELDYKTKKFWYDMIEKYPYLKNKPIAIDDKNWVFFQINSSKEFHKYTR